MKNLTTIYLSWEELSAIFSALLSKLLGKTVKCRAKEDDYDYWAVMTDIGLNDADMGHVCIHAGQTGEALVEELPSSTGDDMYHSISMMLAEKLLSKELGVSWECTHVDAEDGLYFIGCNSDEIKARYEKIVRENIEDLMLQLYNGPERSNDLMDCGYADGCYDTWISVLDMMGISHTYKTSDVFDYGVDAPEEEDEE